MKALILSSALWLLLYSNIVNANLNESLVGYNHSISSKALDSNVSLQVYVPEDYMTNKKQYPVLFILDGQQYFLSGVGALKAMRSPRAIPEMIVVGITLTDDLRWTWLSERSSAFSTFLKDELTPFVEQKFRINEHRIAFGWEASAYYLSDLIFRKPNIFSGVILSNGGYTEMETVTSAKFTKARYLYLINSKKDIYNIEYTDNFAQILINAKVAKLHWQYELVNSETHESLAHLALFKGLKHYYHNYNSLSFESIEEFIELGGMDFLNNYFKQRAVRFGGDDKIDNSTKNTLIWLAWNRDNFEYFSIFMREFSDVLETKRYASAYWQNRLGQFYLKHKDYPNAIKHFEIGLNQYSDSRFDKKMIAGLELALQSLE